MNIFTKIGKFIWGLFFSEGAKNRFASLFAGIFIGAVFGVLFGCMISFWILEATQ